MSILTSILFWALAAFSCGVSPILGTVCLVWAPESCEDSVLRDLRQAIQDVRRDPADADAYVRRGAAYRELNRPAQAAEDYSKAIQLGKTDGQIYLTRSKCRHMAGRSQAALQDARIALDLMPTNPLCYHRLADIYCDLRDYDAASNAYSQGLAIDPTDAALHGCFGNMYRQQGDLEAAEREYDAAIELDPTDPYPYQCRAKLSATRGDHEKAIADFTVVIDAAPTCYLRRLQIGAHMGRAQSLCALGRGGFRRDRLKAVQESIRQKIIEGRIQKIEAST